MAADTPGHPYAVVVGAGIGGLAAAAGLTRMGRSVLVLERAATLRADGAGISLLANAQRALDQLGVGDRVRELAATMLPGGEGVRTAGGRRLMKPTDPAFVRRHGLSTAVLLRPGLHRTLRDAVPAAHLLAGAEVTGVERRADGTALVHYRREGAPVSVPAQVVIAADGLNSRLRGRMWPDAAPPVYSGHSVWRGIAEVDRAEPGGTTWGRGREFGRMPLADGRVYWYAVANTPQGTRHPDEHAEVVRHFGTWHRPVPDLLGRTPPGAVRHDDVFELPLPLPAFASGRTALLGDAAHAMTSDLGQGACQALEDAVVLCAALAAHPDPEEALADYDARRRPRAQAIVAASRRVGRMKLRERWWQVLARDALTTLAPPRTGEAALARIGDWHPPHLTRAAAR